MDYVTGFETNKDFFDSFPQFDIRKSVFREKNKKSNISYVDGGVGGIPLAWREDDKTVFIDSSDTHSLIMGATGSKKSRLLVMPTVNILGKAGESMIITDPKAEIYNRTAHNLSENGYRVFVINFRDPSLGDSWNPLKIPYEFYCNYEIDKAYEIVNDVATNLISEAAYNKDPYWDYAASDLFFWLTLILFKFCKDNNLSELVNIDSLLYLRRKFFEDSVEGRLSKDKLIWKYIDEDDIIAASVTGATENAHNTQRNILCTLDTKLRMFAISPTLMDMLSTNTIDMSDIGNKKTAIFLIMPDEKTSYHRLISLFVKQSYECIINEAQSKHGGVMPIRINYVLDEFSSLPTIEDFPAMITAARSRNIRFNLVIQSKHQLLQRYKSETESIVT